MTTYDIYKLATLSGLFYYFYNEVAFLALSEVTPLQHTDSTAPQISLPNEAMENKAACLRDGFGSFRALTILFCITRV